jgi:hypothetical protein
MRMKVIKEKMYNVLNNNLYYIIMNIDKLRQYKIFNMAIFDILVTYLSSYFIKKVFKLKYSYLNIFIFLIIIGIIVHKVLNIDTMLGYYLGLNGKPERL